MRFSNFVTIWYLCVYHCRQLRDGHHNLCDYDCDVFPDDCAPHDDASCEYAPHDDASREYAPHGDACDAS